MKETRSIGIGRFAAIMALAAAFFMGDGTSLAAPPPIPPVVKIGVHEVGTGGHLVASIAVETIIQKYGNKIRAVPQGVEISRNLMGRTGTVDVVVQSSHTILMINEGIFGYDTPAWGPQPIRAIFEPSHSGLVLGVRGDSNIKTFADLKGRTVATFPASPATTWMLNAGLAFGGLTRKDVVSVKYTSSGKAMAAVKEGKLDCTFWNVTAAHAYELASLPAGLHYLQMPADDKKGWERMLAKYPIFRPKLVVRGAGASKEKPVAAYGQANPNFFVWPHVSADITYFLAKALHETYPVYAAKDETMKADWTIDEHWTNWEGPVGIMPLHEGAIRYYKEVGMWNPKREKINQERLKHQEELKALWEQTLTEVSEKKIKSTEFSKFWLKKKEAAGFYVP
jgi:TRAP transporter TAXI family solute receptor